MQNTQCSLRSTYSNYLIKEIYLVVGLVPIGLQIELPKSDISIYNLDKV